VLGHGGERFDLLEVSASSFLHSVHQSFGRQQAYRLTTQGASRTAEGGDRQRRPQAKDQMMAKRDAIFPANRQALYQSFRYSAAIRSGDLLFVSGQVGSREDGSPEHDFEAQVRLAFDNLASVLSASGCSFDDIIDVTTFHTDPATQFETVLAVKDALIPEPPYPNWTAVGVTWLAGFDFEIKVIARIPQA
jgi:enamine deaminase RidA (YjgF/YER057c/UK114 family)